MKLKAIITNRVFLAVTASVLGIGLASGAVFSVMYRPSETPFGSGFYSGTDRVQVMVC